MGNPTSFVAAAEIEYKFEGVVSNIDTYIDTGKFSVGDVVSGSFVFDPELSTGDYQFPEDPSLASYKVLTGLRYILVGSHVYEASTTQTDTVNVWNNYTQLGRSFDALEIVMAPIFGDSIEVDRGTWIDELPPIYFGIYLEDSTQSVFFDESLPAVIPDLDSFDRKAAAVVFREWDDLYCSHCRVDFILTRLSPITVEELLIELVEIVTNLNLHKGIASSLDGKLSAALKAVDDLNSANDAAAIGSLGAFISAVEAQRGKELTDDEANLLIAKANEIIAKIEG